MSCGLHPQWVHDAEDCPLCVERRTTLLVLWTIYDHPRDFPRHIVVRAHLVLPSGPRAASVGCLYDTLDEARRDMQAGGCCVLARDLEDDEVIVETWL